MIEPAENDDHAGGLLQLSVPSHPPLIGTTAARGAPGAAPHDSHGGALAGRRTAPAIRPLWDAASGQFNGVQLRAAIVGRGWTVGEFARDARVSRACVYKALAGRAVSDRTVVSILAALEARRPSVLLDG